VPPISPPSGVAQRILQILFACANRHSFKLHAYCAMPDHLHILAEGLQEYSDLREFIRLFKQRTAFAHRQTHHRVLWEMSYYDHILRPNEPLEIAAAYIWQNPVRKKLCTDPALYPFSGSQSIPWIRPRSCSGGSSDPFFSSDAQTDAKPDPQS
jgi:putative transposase